MLDFQIPRITSESAEQNRGTFTIEPLDRGFGYTFGNSLRRVLLSSLSGAAVTSVRIEGVAHEFSTIHGVKEDVTDIVLNLKGVVCRMHSDASEVEAPLVVSGPGEITATDIDLPAGVEILNPEVHIATLEMDAGPILAQEVVPVLPGDTEETLHERIKVVERSLYPATLLWALGELEAGRPIEPPAAVHEQSAGQRSA